MQAATHEVLISHFNPEEGRVIAYAGTFRSAMRVGEGTATSVCGQCNAEECYLYHLAGFKLHDHALVSMHAMTTELYRLCCLYLP